MLCKSKGHQYVSSILLHFSQPFAASLSRPSPDHARPNHFGKKYPSTCPSDLLILFWHLTAACDLLHLTTGPATCKAKTVVQRCVSSEVNQLDAIGEEEACAACDSLRSLVCYTFYPTLRAAWHCFRV